MQGSSLPLLHDLTSPHFDEVVAYIYIYIYTHCICFRFSLSLPLKLPPGLAELASSFSLFRSHQLHRSSRFSCGIGQSTLNLRRRSARFSFPCCFRFFHLLGVVIFGFSLEKVWAKTCSVNCRNVNSSTSAPQPQRSADKLPNG